MDQASVVYKTSERGQCYYRVIEAGAKVQTPDTSKEGREVLKGSDTLTITGLSEGEKDVVIVVKDLAGNVCSPLVIRIPDVRKKNNGTAGNGAMEIPVRSPIDPDMVEIKVKPESRAKAIMGKDPLQI